VALGKDRRCVVYALSDPRTKCVRYVGKSTWGLRRAQTTRACPTNAPFREWMTGLRSVGLNATISILEELPDASWLDDAESFWIAQGRGLGWPLVNLAKGGPGAPGATHSAESIAKTAAGLRRHIRTDEHRRRLSDALKGKSQTDAARAKRAISCGGGPFYDDTGERHEFLASAARKYGVTIQAISYRLGHPERTGFRREEAAWR
jgi:hypothetical protein